MRTVDDYAQYRLAHRDGMTIRRIARTFHVSRRKVREALASPEPQPYTRIQPPPLPVLGPFTAIVEMSAASGLALLPAQDRNPFHTTTYGTGELLLEASKLGIRHILLAIGGRAIGGYPLTH